MCLYFFSLQFRYNLYVEWHKKKKKIGLKRIFSFFVNPNFAGRILCLFYYRIIMHKVCLYISPEPKGKPDFEDDQENGDVESEGILPWWTKERNCNRVIYCKRQNKLDSSRKEEEELLNNKYLGIINEVRKKKKKIMKREKLLPYFFIEILMLFLREIHSHLVCFSDFTFNRNNRFEQMKFAKCRILLVSKYLKFFPQL